MHWFESHYVYASSYVLIINISLTPPCPYSLNLRPEFICCLSAKEQIAANYFLIFFNIP